MAKMLFGLILGLRGAFSSVLDFRDGLLESKPHDVMVGGLRLKLGSFNF